MAEEEVTAEAETAGTAVSGPGWHLLVARVLGRTARRTTAQLESVGGKARQLLDPGALGRPRGSLPDALKKLATMLEGKGSDDFSSLTNDPEFWGLLDQVRSHRPRRPALVAGVGADEKKPDKAAKPQKKKAKDSGDKDDKSAEAEPKEDEKDDSKDE